QLSPQEVGTEIFNLIRKTIDARDPDLFEEYGVNAILQNTLPLIEQHYLGTRGSLKGVPMLASPGRIVPSSDLINLHTGQPVEEAPAIPNSEQGINTKLHEATHPTRTKVEAIVRDLIEKTGIDDSSQEMIIDILQRVERAAQQAGT